MKNGQMLREFFASIVVFFIALPLCMGIAMASGAPPAAGLLTGIVGGIIGGYFAGCRVQVSGPAAGLTVVVLDIIQKHGFEALGIVVALAGVIQLIAGVLRLGRLFQSVSPAVVYGMLAGIGAIILLGQSQIMMDMKTGASPIANLMAIPASLRTLVSPEGGQHLQAALLGVFTIAVMIFWKATGLNKRTRIPEALPAIVLATVASLVLNLSVRRVGVPESVTDLVSLASFNVLAGLDYVALMGAVLTLAFVASAESMLSAASVDQIHTCDRTNYSKELRAQGIGNIICGLLGGLPMTGVVVRSKVNIEAGATTRLSSMLHGCWLLLAVAFLPFLLKLIPVCSLAALLVLTGWKLMDLKILKVLYKFGIAEVLIFLTTFGLIVFEDLLVGVVAGLVLAFLRVGWQLATRLQASVVKRGDRYKLVLRGMATFIMKWKLASVLEDLPTGATVDLCDRLVYLDHASLEMIQIWADQHVKSGGVLNWDEEALIKKVRQSKEEVDPDEVSPTPAQT